MEPTSYQLDYYVHTNGTKPFLAWFQRLPDQKTQQLLLARLKRLSEGNVGDSKSVGEGVHELRVHHGPGYRVYYGRVGQKIILLLTGGDKSSQAKDIRKAYAYWQQYQQDHV